MNDELGRDFAHLLLNVLDRTDIEEKESKGKRLSLGERKSALNTASLIRVAALNLSQLQIFFQLMRKDILNFGLD